MRSKIAALRFLNNQFLEGRISLRLYEDEVAHLAKGADVSERIRLSNIAFVTL